MTMSTQILAKLFMKDGVRGGSRGAILRRFDDSRDDNSAFDKETTDSVTKTRWLEIKQVHFTSFATTASAQNEAKQGAIQPTNSASSARRWPRVSMPSPKSILGFVWR